MPIAVAAPVRVFIPTSCSASPRVWVMSSPGRASEPTARIQTTSGLTSTDSARLTFTSSTSVLFTAESGTTSAASASTAPTASVAYEPPAVHSSDLADVVPEDLPSLLALRQVEPPGDPDVLDRLAGRRERGAPRAR